MSDEQRLALADATPTTETIKDAVTFPRDRLGEPLDISGERFDAWLREVKRRAYDEGYEDGRADGNCLSVTPPADRPYRKEKA